MAVAVRRPEAEGEVLERRRLHRGGGEAVGGTGRLLRAAAAPLEPERYVALRLPVPRCRQLQLLLGGVSRHLGGRDTVSFRKQLCAQRRDDQQSPRLARSAAKTSLGEKQEVPFGT